MKAKIHFTVGADKPHEDTVVFSGTVEEIRELASNFFKIRGLDENKCNPWSEVVEE